MTTANAPFRIPPLSSTEGRRRIARLVRRAEFLEARVEVGGKENKALTFDDAEAVALRWILDLVAAQGAELVKLRGDAQPREDREREDDVMPATPIPTSALRHGVNCRKVVHARDTGYLHGADDDAPYDVDGVAYCGRCHRVIERR